MIEPNGLLNAGILIATGLAFAPHIRKEIFKRDHGVCQCESCLGVFIIGEPFKWDLGFNVNASHYPELHQKEEDFNMDNGRILSVFCHLLEEIERHNHKGVQLLYEKQSIMNTAWLKRNDWHDIKPPLNDFYDYVDGKRNADAKLITFFTDRL